MSSSEFDDLPRRTPGLVQGDPGVGPRESSAGPPLQIVGYDTPLPDSSSQAIQMFPAVGARPADPPRRGRRLLGIPWPVWLLAAVAAIVVVVGGLLLLPRLGPNAPVEPPGDQAGRSVEPTLGAGGPGQADPGQTDQGPAASGSTGTGGTAGPTGSASPGAGGGGPAVVVRPLALTGFSVEPRSGLNLLPLLGWKVTITIENPADVAQSWTNVSVVVSDDPDLAVTSLVEGVRVYDSGRLVCAEPETAAAATIAAHSAKTIEFTVRSLTEPHSPQLNNDDCDPSLAD